MNATRVQQWRRWAPFGLFLVAPAVGAVADLLVSGPRGHWSGHVGSEAAAAGQLLAVVAGAVLARRRLNVLLVVLLAVVAVGLVLEVVGNQSGLPPRSGRPPTVTRRPPQSARASRGLSRGTRWPEPATCWSSLEDWPSPSRLVPLGAWGRVQRWLALCSRSFRLGSFPRLGRFSCLRFCCVDLARLSDPMLHRSRLPALPQPRSLAASRRASAMGW
jgi:hypothetical protein